MTSVRKATFDDIPWMISVGRVAHSQSENARYAFDEPSARQLGAAAITMKTMCAFVAETDKRSPLDGNVVGILIGHEDKLPYAKVRFATDIVFYAIEPGAGRALMDRFTTWAFEERRVDQMLLGVSFGGKSARSATALYRRKGFTPVGGLFVKNRGVT